MNKTQLQYYGPMVILRCTQNRAYRPSKLDRSISKLCYATFCLILYHSHSPLFITVTHLLDDKQCRCQDNDPLDSEQLNH